MSERVRHLTKENFEFMEANVKRGAAYFDLTYPGWWKRNTPVWLMEHFNMLEQENDIYGVVGMEHSEEDPKFGNWPFMGEQAEWYVPKELDLGYMYLQHLWLKEVLIRWSPSAKEHLGDSD